MLALAVVGFYLLNTRFAIPVRGHANWSLDAVRVSWLTYDVYSHVRVLLIAAGVVLALVVTRAWCRYLCPLGALLALGSRLAVLRLGRNREACSGCGKYPRDCRTYTTPGTADCVVCGDCIEGCPQGAVRLGRRAPSTPQPAEAEPASASDP
jgi:polyferredoxin